MIWLAVTPDEYELPIAVADSAKELADMLGISTPTVKTSVLRHSDGSLTGRRLIKVEVEQ